MDLAKNHVDFGVFTNNEQDMLTFWQQDIGLPFEETLPLGNGARQQRHGMNGSVFKINVSPTAVEPGIPTGYRHLTIARDGLDEPRSTVDPDGNSVTLVPRGHDGITGIRIEMAVRDEAAFHEFYGKALGLEPAGDSTYRCGDTLIQFERSDKAQLSGDMRGTGYRYMTIQVKDVDKEHQGFLDRGATEGFAPRTLGEVARISFIRDPDGNWIEISQRASLTGALGGNG